MQARGPPWPKAAAAAAGERHRWHRQSFVEIYATKSNVAMRLIASCGRIEASQAARADGGQDLSCWVTSSVKLHRAVGRCRRYENVVRACRCVLHDARERALLCFGRMRRFYRDGAAAAQGEGVFYFSYITGFRFACGWQTSGVAPRCEASESSLQKSVSTEPENSVLRGPPPQRVLLCCRRSRSPPSSAAGNVCNHEQISRWVSCI
jgi:hypothetical protein